MLSSADSFSLCLFLTRRLFGPKEEAHQEEVQRQEEAAALPSGRADEERRRPRWDGGGKDAGQGPREEVSWCSDSVCLAVSLTYSTAVGRNDCAAKKIHFLMLLAFFPETNNPRMHLRRRRLKRQSRAKDLRPNPSVTARHQRRRKRWSRRRIPPRRTSHLTAGKGGRKRRRSTATAAQRAASRLTAASLHFQRKTRRRRRRRRRRWRWRWRRRWLQSLWAPRPSARKRVNENKH